LENILIIAGEQSGDIHGAALMQEMKKIDNSLTFIGIGGDNMIAEGLNALQHIKNMAFLGFTEVVKHLPFIISVQNELLKTAKQKEIKKVILIDYPGFNLSIARKLKKFGVEIFYYIAPQIWAWGKRRIKKIKKYITKMIVVFPFEKEFYENAGVKVEYVGHPLVDRLDKFNFCSRDNFFQKYGLDSEKDILLIMPGSRKHEIKKIFPEVISAASVLSIDNNFQIVVACSENINEEIFNSFNDIKFKVIKNESYNLLNLSKFGIIKSGTSTMEAALIGLPFVTVYSTSSVTYWIGKNLVKLRSIAMPNILADKMIIKEFIQNDLSSKNLISHINSFLNDNRKIEELKTELKKIKETLGYKSAPRLAAQIICS
jgi:lipid-A-disaccharide synthase